MRNQLFLSCLFILATSICSAQQGVNPSETFFKTLDKNSDGLLTREELGAEKEALFNRLVTLADKNEDGKLTRDEFLAGVSPKSVESSAPQGRPQARLGDRQQFPGPEQMFERLDRDKNGKLTKEEMPEPFRERFAPIFEKLNKESLNAEEFSTALSILMERPNTQRGLPDEGQFFERLDRNQDGKVTLDEVPEEIRERVKPMFDRLGKSAITKDDFAKLRGMQPDDRPKSGRPDDGRPQTGERPDFMRRPDEDGPPSRGPAFFAILDTDRDGMLSASELSSASQLVAKLDRNEDRKLDPAEMMGFSRGSGSPVRRPEMRGTGESDRPRRPEMAETQQPAGRTRDESRPKKRDAGALSEASNTDFAKSFFSRFDQNEDGKISKEEAPERMQQNFGRLDSNEDGSISQQELSQALSRRDQGK